MTLSDKFLSPIENRDDCNQLNSEIWRWIRFRTNCINININDQFVCDADFHQNLDQRKPKINKYHETAFDLGEFLLHDFPNLLASAPIKKIGRFKCICWHWSYAYVYSQCTMHIELWLFCRLYLCDCCVFRIGA